MGLAMVRDDSSNRLPDFLIMGAAKSGTTSLYHYLTQHPDIFMSYPLKEPRLFTDIDRIRTYFWQKRGIEILSIEDLIENYMLQGYQGEKLFGEATADYTVGTFSQQYHIPQKIKKINPQMKFIYILRNPFERIVSNYLHILNLGLTTNADINSFFEPNNRHGQIMLSTSLYYQQLKYYLTEFEREQFKIVIFEELISKPQQHLSDIFTFLGLDNYGYSSYNFQAYNCSNKNLGTLCLKFDVRNYQFLVDLFRTDTLKLENFLHRSLNLWDFSPQSWAI